MPIVTEWRTCLRLAVSLRSVCGIINSNVSLRNNICCKECVASGNKSKISMAHNEIPIVAKTAGRKSQHDSQERRRESEGNCKDVHKNGFTSH